VVRGVKLTHVGLFGEQDPYVVVNIGNQQAKTPVHNGMASFKLLTPELQPSQLAFLKLTMLAICSGGGKNPVWGTIMRFINVSPGALVDIKVRALTVNCQRCRSFANRHHAAPSHVQSCWMNTAHGTVFRLTTTTSGWWTSRLAARASSLRCAAAADDL
jgi:hypothetical protein